MLTCSFESEPVFVDVSRQSGRALFMRGFDAGAGHGAGCLQ